MKRSVFSKLSIMVWRLSLVCKHLFTIEEDLLNRYVIGMTLLFAFITAWILVLLTEGGILYAILR